MLRRWFSGKPDPSPPPPVEGLAGDRFPRHSGAWAELRKRIESGPALCIVDTGYTSPANINYLTGLGHSVYLADPVADACTEDWRAGSDPDGHPVWNVEGFLDQSFPRERRTFDIALLWTALDYLPEPFLAPLVARLYEVIHPDGQVLAFFHTRTQGDDMQYYRYHLTAGDDVEMQRTRQFPLQRAFTNRSIERLFAGWAGQRQFLAKDSVSEVLIAR